ncbi:hypothetical protein AAFF_G00385050 [Aldrovandia affinis]|uniref:Uncharacterized protein n=1 Tax=Aldrovandia affinis TaxID=143900 RepID=A0AAD7SET3_9TELE|nr:hypothetical protein AAFF_G00385050 [Aldrovandia affinis]
MGPRCQGQSDKDVPPYPSCFCVSVDGLKAPQGLSCWIVDVIVEIYGGVGGSVPEDVVYHCTRGVTTSWAALRGALLTHICVATTWISPCMLSKSCRVKVASCHTVLSAVLIGRFVMMLSA